ncbi:hypothetical protein [Paracoccus sp. (in: a-proteobacteria)]|uniref:hypothetical protein n=1 Tax=Paracoccus sp. TaxID=267 RepID=UPI0028A5E48D|nr:hypothetical protein [Paracoccus sp. (in: a-proteobacteria)]
MDVFLPFMFSAHPGELRGADIRSLWMRRREDCPSRDNLEDIGVPGSKVRLDLARNRFAFTATLTNLTTGQSVSLALDYVTGTMS